MPNSSGNAIVRSSGAGTAPRLGIHPLPHAGSSAGGALDVWPARLLTGLLDPH